LSLHTEIKRLFSASIIEQAERLEPELVNALEVQAAAGALLRLKGKPDEQVALVKAMQPCTAAALCRWLIDPAFWKRVGNIHSH